MFFWLATYTQPFMSPPPVAANSIQGPGSDFEIALCGLLVGLGGTKKSPAGAGLRLFGKPNSAHQAFWAPPAVGIDEGRRQSVIERPEAERFGPGRQHEIAS